MDNNNNDFNNNAMGQQPDGLQQSNPYSQQPDVTQNPYGQQPDAAQNPYGQTADASQQNFQQFYPQGESQQNPYVQPPVSNVDGGSGKKPKKPLGKGAVAGIIGGGVALVAAIVCGIIFIPKLFKTDKEVVLDAFKETFAASGDTDEYFEETFGASEIKSKISEDGIDCTAAISLDTIQGYEDFGGLSVTFDSNGDQNTKQGDASLVVTYDGTDVFNVGYYTDNDKLYISLDDIIEGYLTLPCEGTLEALANSALGEALEISDSGISGDLKFFADDTEDDSQTSVAVNGDMVNAIENIWDNTVFEKEGKTKIDVNGETVSAREYTVTIGEEDLENSITDIFDAIMTEYKNTGAAEESGLDSEDIDASLSQIEQLIPTVISSDFVLSVYISDGKVVKLSSGADTNIMGVKLSYDFYLDINDDLSGAFEIAAMGQTVGISCDIDDFRNEPNGEIKLYAADEEIELDIESENKTADSTLGFDGSITCIYDDDRIFKLSTDYTLDKTTNTFEGNVGIYGEDDEEDAVEVAFSGQYVDIVRSEGYGCRIDNLSVSVEGAELLAMSSEVSIGTKPQVKGIDSSLPTYDITTMSESDLQDVLEENSSLTEKWMKTIEESGLTGLFGLGSSSATDYIHEDDEDNDDTDVDVETDDEDADYDFEYETDTEYNQHSYKCSDGTVLKIQNAPDGFECTDSSDDYVDFMNDDYETIYYYFQESMELDSLMEDDLSLYDLYYSDYITDKQEGLKTEVDGVEVTYSKVSMNMYDSDITDYFLYRQLTDGTIIKVEVEMYPGDGSLKEDDVLKLIGDDYISVK